MDRTDICRLFGVPEQRLGEIVQATPEELENAKQRFYGILLESYGITEEMVQSFERADREIEQAAIDYLNRVNNQWIRKTLTSKTNSQRKKRTK